MIVSLTLAVKTSSIAEIYAREFTYDSCISTTRADLIPHAANKYSKHFLSKMTATKSRGLTDTTVVLYDFTTDVLWKPRSYATPVITIDYSSCKYFSIVVSCTFVYNYLQHLHFV